MSQRLANAAEALWRRLTIPEKQRRALINEYRDAVQAETIEHLRWMTWDGHESPWFHMVADKLRDELAAKEQP